MVKRLPFHIADESAGLGKRWERTSNSANGFRMERKMQDILAFSLSLNLQLDALPWTISVMKTSPKEKSLIFTDGGVRCKNK